MEQEQIKKLVAKWLQGVENRSEQAEQAGSNLTTIGGKMGQLPNLEAARPLIDRLTDAAYKITEGAREAEAAGIEMETLLNQQ